jgi:purine-binding chemotaxis protein CheW
VDKVGASLLFRVGTCICAIPLEHVVETMRPLPIDALAGMPELVLGVAVIRGAPVPVVDVGRLVVMTGGGAHERRRFVTLAIDAGARRVALAVDDVLGVRWLPAQAGDDLPPLLGGGRSDGVAALRSLDAGLLVVLDAARIVPESVWAAVAAATVPS